LGGFLYGSILFEGLDSFSDFVATEEKDGKYYSYSNTDYCLNV
jgi:hypothetical protein